MPELPEVETVRRTLAPRVLGRAITRATLRLPRILEVGSRRAFAGLAGATIEAIERRGKYLLLRVGDRALVVHLGMTGQLQCRLAEEAVTDTFVRMQSGYQRAVGPHSIDRHTHATLELAGGALLTFRDPRTFGKLLVLPWEELETTPRIARLGPDGLGLPAGVFVERFMARRGAASVKARLLDQSFIAGVGNIYADEACFAAGIRPATPTRRIGATRAARLAAAVEEALRRGIENCGTSFSDFVDAEGRAGGNQEVLHVYGRGGEPCVRCDATLVKSVVAQRGTVHCPRCQRP